MKSKYRNHRRIVEKRIGRKLKHEEIIHHKDHDKENNEEKNLAILCQHEHNIELFKGKNAYYKYLSKKKKA